MTVLSHLWGDTHASWNVYTEDDQRFILSGQSAWRSWGSRLQHEGHVIDAWNFFLFYVQLIVCTTELTMPDLQDKSQQ